MYALILPNGQMHAPLVSSALTTDVRRAAKWINSDRAATACHKLNRHRTKLQPKFELVVLYQEADVCAA